MASTLDGAFFSFPGAAECTKEADRALVPITVKMIKDESVFPDFFYRQFLASPVTVRFVGRTVGLTNSDVSARFVLEDGTGSVEVTYWFPLPGTVPPHIITLDEGCYVHVVGKVDRRNGHTTIKAFSCWRISDFNEITLHFIDAIHSYLVRVGPPPLGRGPSTRSACGVVGYNHRAQQSIGFAEFTTTSVTDEELEKPNADDSLEAPRQEPEMVCEDHLDVCPPLEVTINDTNCGKSDETQPIDVSHQDTSSEDKTIAEKYEEICPTQEDPTVNMLRDDILCMIKRCQPEAGLEGVVVNNITEKLGVQEALVRETLQKLEDIGEIYQTVDSDHYRAT